MEQDTYCFICGAKNDKDGNCSDSTCPRYVEVNTKQDK